MALPNNYINSIGIPYTDLPVFFGGTGQTNLPLNALVVGNVTDPVKTIEPGTDGQVLLGGSGLIPAFGTITSSGGALSFTTGANSLDINLSSDFDTTAIHGWNGSILESTAVSVASDGATITFSVEKTGGGDLTVVFSDGYYDWDTTPADTVTLTAGTDTAPQINYVYFLQSTKTLTASTAGWPGTEHAPLATVLCQSAASLQTDGPYKLHAWTDHVVKTTDNMGHISHLNYWIRQQNATWASGVAPTLTITPNGGAPDNVIFTSTAGVVLQLHTHAFPAFAGTPDIYVVNDSVTAYNKVTDLNTQLTDSTGASMSGRYFSLVIWGVVNEGASNCKLMCNLPSGSYNNQADLEDDPNGYADFSIPTEFTGTGFLIAQLLLRHQAAASGTWTEIDTIDLRGLIPNTSPGGSGAFGSSFDDSAFNIYDNADDTKKIAFQASGITTATTRTLTVQDADGIIALSGVANYGTGVTSNTAYAVLCGGTTATGPIQSIASVGTSGQVLTSNGAGALPTFQAPSGGGITWNEETGTSANMAVDNGYIANNAALVTLTLPDTAAVGSVVRVAGKGAGGWRIAQNAGETIRFSSQSTTTGVGGYLEFTQQYDAVELVCITANTDWVVISSVGNITVV